MCPDREITMAGPAQRRLRILDCDDDRRLRSLYTMNTSVTMALVRALQKRPANKETAAKGVAPSAPVPKVWALVSPG